MVLVGAQRGNISSVGHGGLVLIVNFKGKIYLRTKVIYIHKLESK